MKKLLPIILTVLILASCARAPQTAPNPASSPELAEWQQQFDLGVRYLSEGKYEEAIIAFLAVIEIEPKRVEAYDKLADAYIGAGDLDAAIAALQQGFAATGDDALQSRAEELAGELGNEKGEFGQTLFERRSDYIAYEDLTAESQELLGIFVNAAIAGDTDTLETHARAEREQSISFLTTYGDYKVRLRISPPNADGTFNTGIEIRPENGMGYYVSYGNRTGDSNGSYTQLSTTTFYYSCPCENWQWNGAASYATSTFYSDGFSQISTGSGTVLNSLRHGTFVSEMEWWYSSSGYDRTTTTTDVYDNGYWVSGDTDLKDAGYIFAFPSMWIPPVTPELFADALYW